MRNFALRQRERELEARLQRFAANGRTAQAAADAIIAEHAAGQTDGLSVQPGVERMANDQNQTDPIVQANIVKEFSDRVGGTHPPARSLRTATRLGCGCWLCVKVFGGAIT